MQMNVARDVTRGLVVFIQTLSIVCSQAVLVDMVDTSLQKCTKAITSIPSCCTTAPAFSRSSPAGGSATSAQRARPSAFAVAGPMTFNALPFELRDSTVNTNTFRRLLKTHFFSVYLHV